MHYMNFIKPDMQLYGNFASHKSAVACAFRHALSFDLGEEKFILHCLEGWRIEQPPWPWHEPDANG